MEHVRFLRIEEVVIIYDRMIEIGGGAEGIRDIELLHSALGRPQASFRGKPLYPDTYTMAAAMLQSLVKNHPFVDGNKRTAFFATLRFLEKNGLSLVIEQDDIGDFMVKVDTENLSVNTIARWFMDRVIGE